MRFRRRLIVFPAGRPSYTYTETFEQPLRDRVVYVAYRLLWNICWRVKLAAWVLGQIDRVLERRHKRHCNNDCGTYTRVKTGEKTRACVRPTLDAQMDIKLALLDYRNNT